MNNEVPPTLLLFEKASVHRVQIAHIPSAHIVEGYPSCMPFGVMKLEKDSQRFRVVIEQVVVECPRYGYVCLRAHRSTSTSQPTL